MYAGRPTGRSATPIGGWRLAARAPLPQHPDELTATWLSAALGAAGVSGSASIGGCDVEIIGEERGFTGVVARIRPQYWATVDGAPVSLIGKFPLAERAGASSYRELQLVDPNLARAYVERAAREVRFYLEAGHASANIPRCYYGHVDPEAGEVVLLIEDLDFATPGDALSGCSVAEARSVLAGIAALHGRWWAHRELPRLSWAGDWASGNPARAERFARQAGPVIDRYGERMPAGIPDLLAALAGRFEGVMAALAAAPPTLLHLDLHLDNVMFAPAGGGPRAYILDWQSVSRGPAVLDVAGFVVESLSVDDRRSRERELLRGYHAELRRRGVDDYPFERLWDDLLRALLVRLAGAAGWLARVEVEELAGRERSLVEAIFEPGRLFAALADHDVAARLDELARAS